MPNLIYLETKGIIVGGAEFIGTVCILSHDNLGANSLLGFQQSFNANYYCRICCTPKSEAQFVLDHDKMTIRDRENYMNDLGNLSHGVVAPCIFNQLNFYHFLDSPTVDIMHDVLEGVVPYEMKLVLQKLISLGCLSLEIVNQRLLAHDFGKLESKNRPSPIKIDPKSNRIVQKAAQAWCLIRFFPVIFGDLISTEEQRKYCELLIQLLECMSYLFCRKFSASTINSLKISIIKHHKLFTDLFPDQKLLPKHHVMCHYPYIIKQSGPLISLWTMRKHNYFVQLANNTKNF